jgi:hypothetical protein
MVFEKERAFGIIKIEGKIIKLYTTNINCSSIHIGSEIRDARWTGLELVFYLTNGKIRRYKSFTSYSTIT